MTGIKSLSSYEHSVPKIWHYNIYICHTACFGTLSRPSNAG